ncbi:Embryo-specific 3 [Spatholobus suberectus]|nr:Embryo-specific 3 [Spatholobus suberectus]
MTGLAIIKPGNPNLTSPSSFLKYKTMNAPNLTLILTFCIIAALSQATPKATQPQAIQSSKLNQTQQQINEGCSYIVTIKTSCSSTFYVRGQISLLFGDAYGNQIHVPRLDGPFEDCSMNTYEIYGPCISQICRLYLYNTGDAGWILETVSIYNYLYDPVTFYYDTYIAEGGPYGFDYCHDY